MNKIGILVRDPVLRIAELSAETGLGRSTIYRGIQNNEFPEGHDLGGGVRDWPLSEIQAWKATLSGQAGPIPPQTSEQQKALTMFGGPKGGPRRMGHPVNDMKILEDLRKKWLPE